MTSVLLCVSYLAVVADPTLHDLPDGVVKVATQVTVQADNTQVRYDVGFNPNTLDQLLKAYAPDTKTDATAKEKLDAFRTAIKSKLEESILVKVGDKLIKAEEISFQPDEVSKHVQVRFNLNYEILISEETKIEIHDSNFKEMGRIWNAGFKAALPVAVKESSTKAIPIRTRPTEKPAGEASPFEITGTVVKLEIGVGSSSDSISMAPLFVLMFALGSAGLVGLLLVPNEPGDGHDDDHH